MKKTFTATLGTALLFALALTFTACQTQVSPTTEPSAAEKLPEPVGEDPFAGKVYTLSSSRYTFGSDCTFTQADLDGTSGEYKDQRIYKYTYNSEKKTISYALYKIGLATENADEYVTNTLSAKEAEVAQLEAKVAAEKGETSNNSESSSSSAEFPIKDREFLTYEEYNNYLSILISKMNTQLDALISRLTALESQTDTEDLLKEIKNKIETFENNKEGYADFWKAINPFANAEYYTYEISEDGTVNLSSYFVSFNEAYNFESDDKDAQVQCSLSHTSGSPFLTFWSSSGSAPNYISKYRGVSDLKFTDSTITGTISEESFSATYTLEGSGTDTVIKLTVTEIPEELLEFKQSYILRFEPIERTYTPYTEE